MDTADPPPEPQPVLTPISEAAIFLVLTVQPGAEDAVRDLLGDVRGLQRSVGFRLPEGELTCVAGIGDAFWTRLFGAGGPRPAGLHRFVALDGPVHRAPSTPGDLLFHLRAHRLDLCFELAQRLLERLRGSATVVDEVHGFRSFDERDLLGFVDGTESLAGARPHDVIIGEEDPAFAGGSYVAVQKYVHDLKRWDAMTVEAQERTIGRTKLTDIELADDIKAPDSHVALTTITDPDGTERRIVRYNMPFGRVGAEEFGTYFIGYARTPDVIEQMLCNMFLGTAEAAHDRVLDVSTALTGTLFFVPTSDFLDDLPDAAPPDSVAVADAATEPADPEGSLGIGDLRGSRAP
jgi:putative iron-dependent peroxidase